jgi:peptidoglycan hydrolase-like protein with peptidoglycan-binding domain
MPDEPRPEQGKIITKDNLKLVQQRLQAEWVYAGPVDGELKAQTEAALRQYQQKQGIPASGAPDEQTLKERKGSGGRSFRSRRRLDADR